MCTYVNLHILHIICMCVVHVQSNVVGKQFEEQTKSVLFIRSTYHQY